MAGYGAHREWNSKQETDEAVLTITKAPTKMTNCTRGAKKLEEHDTKKFRHFTPDTCPPHSNSFRRHWSRLHVQGAAKK